MPRTSLAPLRLISALMNDSASPSVGRVQLSLRLGLLLLALLTALLPWYRNRGYVRDFFDYGVIIGATGRMEQGQKPYADFITPIQTGWYAWNWAAERVAGGTFLAMTWSGAASIVLALVGLTLLLARRWPWSVAVLVGWAITCATAAQHTIYWYNPWGVVCLAAAAWAGAVAPVWRRETLGWHAVMMVALFLGGINKLNMQLMALGIATGWAVRAGLTGRSTWRRVAVTLAAWGCAGGAVPVLAEMAWTGVSFARWWHNVIAQMSGGRAGMLAEALHWEYLFKPCHDYYRPLLLPQAGLVMLLMLALSMVGLVRQAWRNPFATDRWLVWGCGGVALLGGLILFSTNMDIVHIALGGVLAMMAALWLGFGAPARGAWFKAAIIAPAVLTGIVGWESAWRGTRSQFGYSNAPRSDYQPAETAGDDFAYLRGTRVPPEMFDALQKLGQWRNRLPEAEKNAVLYAGGTELAAHFWPAPHTPELPLYILGGHQFGQPEYQATKMAVSGGEYQHILVSLVLDHWEPELAEILRIRYARHSLGGVFYRYSRFMKGSVTASPLELWRSHGGATDGRLLLSSAELFGGSEPDAIHFIGTSDGRETMKLAAATNRLAGQVVVRRLTGDNTIPLAADFSIYAEHDEAHRFLRWEQRVELHPGQMETLVDYSIDSSGMPARFYVETPPDQTGLLATGWTVPKVLHSALEGPETPRWFFASDRLVQTLSPAEVDQLLPADRTWTPDRVYMRGGRVTPDGLELEPGGELWIRAADYVTELSGTVVAGPEEQLANPPGLWGVWLKGARMEVISLQHLRPPVRELNFKLWCPEPNGWLILAADQLAEAPSIRIKINRLVR